MSPKSRPLVARQNAAGIDACCPHARHARTPRISPSASASASMGRLCRASSRLPALILVPLALSLGLSLALGHAEHAAAMAAGQSNWPLLFLLPCMSLSSIECGTMFYTLNRTSCAPSLVADAAGAASPWSHRHRRRRARGRATSGRRGVGQEHT